MEGILTSEQFEVAYNAFERTCNTDFDSVKVRSNELLGRKIRMETPTIIAPAVCITRCIQQIGRSGESTFDLTSM